MILVTVGTEKFPFDRLMTWVEELIQTGAIAPQEEVIIQYGSCTYVPNNGKTYSLLPESDFNQLLAQADLIIAHCGEGTIDTLATNNVPFILVPRSHQYGEHVDDHQIELAQALEQQGVAIAYNKKDLQEFIANPVFTPVTVTPRNYYAYASQLIEEQFMTQQTQTEVESFLPQNNIFNFFQSIQKLFTTKTALSN